MVLVDQIQHTTTNKIKVTGASAPVILYLYMYIFYPVNGDILYDESISYT